MSYDEYRKAKIESGLLYQDFVIDALSSLLGLHVQQYASRTYQLTVGETRQGVEIKHDEKYASTGNLWIEMAEKARPRAGDYVPSGIHRNDNAWLYVIGDYNTIFVFARTMLIELANSGRYRRIENRTRTSEGFLLPSAHAQRWAAMVLQPNAEVRVLKNVKDVQELGRRLHAELLDDARQRSLFGGER